MAGKYRLTRKRLVRIHLTKDGRSEEEVIIAGVPFTPTEAELKSFRNLLEPTGDVSPSRGRPRKPKGNLPAAFIPSAPEQPSPSNVHVEVRPKPSVPPSYSPPEEEDQEEEDQEESLAMRIKTLNVNGVLHAVEMGEIDAAAALELERKGSKRVTLISQLEVLVQSED